jgi:hypothetical protein
MRFRSRRRWLLIGLPIGGVAALVVGFILLSPPTGASTNCNPSAPRGLGSDSTFVLAPCHSTVPIRPHSYTSYSVRRLSDGESVVGQYTSNRTSDVSLAAYLLNTTEFGQVMGIPNVTAPPPHYLWSESSVPECNISIPVPGSPIQYYIVIENTGNSSVSIDWTQTLLVFYATH